MKTFALVALGLSLGISGAFAEEQKKDFKLVETCKKDCPTAKTDEDAHKCAEKLGRLNKSFKKSKCWEVNEQYEAANSKEVSQ